MRRLLLKGVGIGIFCFILFVLYTVATTRNHSPADVAKFEGDALNVEVHYCRPYKKDRLIFGSKSEGALQPWGTYWRVGANEATEIVFSADVRIEGKTVKAGRYRVYAIPGKEEWKIGLNEELGKWGYWKPNFDQDVMNFTVPSKELEQPVEQFTINFEAAPEGKGTVMIWQWDTVEVRTKIHPAS